MIHYIQKWSKSRFRKKHEPVKYLLLLNHLKVLTLSSAHLDELWGEASCDADPVDCGDEAVSGHRAEGERAQPFPLLAEVMRVDLSEEEGQDHGQDRHQVHLPPILPGHGYETGSKVKSYHLHSSSRIIVCDILMLTVVLLTSLKSGRRVVNVSHWNIKIQWTRISIYFISGLIFCSTSSPEQQFVIF